MWAITADAHHNACAFGVDCTNFKRSKGTNRPVKASREVEEGGTGVNFDHRDFP